MGHFGKEIIRGFRGTESINVGQASFGPRGGLRAGYTSMPRGIAKRISPNGQRYVELKQVTVDLRRRKGNYRGKDFILRETDEMFYSPVYEVGPNARNVNVFFSSSDMNMRSWRHEKGIKALVSESLSKGHKGKPRVVEIPARPHRGVQPRVPYVIKKLMSLWAHRQKVV